MTDDQLNELGRRIDGLANSYREFEHDKACAKNPCTCGLVDLLNATEALMNAHEGIKTRRHIGPGYASPEASRRES